VAKSNGTITIIEGLTPDGQAFIEVENKTIKLPGFLPGDKIEIFFTNDSKVESVKLIDPSPNRVKPDCFFHGPCGGCDLLELSEKGRKKEKQAMIERALARIKLKAKPVLKPFIAAKELIRYRPRVRLHQSRNYRDRQSGYLASDNYPEKIPGGIVPITACAIITQQLNKRLVAARKILDQIPICLENLVLMSSSSKHSDKVVGHATLQKGKSPAYFHKDLLKVMRSAQLKGLTVSGPDGKVKKSYGTPSVTGLIAPGTPGGPYEAEPSFFVQGNIYQNPVLIKTVVSFCRPFKGQRIIEGYSGAGNFTLPLAAEGAKIQAIESHPGAVRAADKNLHNSEFNDHIELIKGDAIKIMPTLEPEPDILLLDPPRSGTHELKKIISTLKPKRIVYVFCDLNALTRDSQKIVNEGYELTEVQGIDLYPRTHHVEAVCLFEKN
jgi:23S rRNA (uracil1939-C5)-methyltransferase